MRIGNVVGNLWATKKEEGLLGHKLLLVHLWNAECQPGNTLLVATDSVGAGEGDVVLVSFGGGARLLGGNQKAPVDAAIVGIVDSIERTEKKERKEDS